MTAFSTPTLTQQLGKHYVLWFDTSNQYLIVDDTLYGLLNLFLRVQEFNGFAEALKQIGFESSVIEPLYQDIVSFLETTKTPNRAQHQPVAFFEPWETTQPIQEGYTIGDLHVHVNYGSESLQQLLHPQFSHWSAETFNGTPDLVLDVAIKGDDIHLFKNGTILASYPTSDYYFLQGKFGMELLCGIHNNQELDWLGTLHASTIAKNDQGILLIGDSGMGKSTFTALLLAHGFDVLADDISPLRFEDSKFYPYPAGISIKSGAFEVLKAHFEGFETLEPHYINPYKGHVKFIDPFQYGTHDLKTGISCHTMVCVHYQEDHPTTLAPMPVEEALSMLIPESWIAPHTSHAQKFMDWLDRVQFYKLTYSHSAEAIQKFSSLFSS